MKTIKVYLIIIVLFSFSCKKEESKNNTIKTDKIVSVLDKKFNTPFLIEGEDLQTKINDSTYKIIDFRKPEEYEQSHIPNALNVWRNQIENHDFPYKGIMASPKSITVLLSSLGIKNTDTIVIYDDIGLCNAARFWWILYNLDIKHVKMLNGGLDAWKAIEGKLTKAIPEPEPKMSRYKLPSYKTPELYAAKQDVLNAIQNNIKLLDTRTEDEFSGKQKKNGATKGGRIPTSIRIDWANAINYNGDKKLKSKTELEAIYSKLNVSKNEPIIVYCHSGVRSAHTTFVLTQLLGYTNVKNYDGSWIEWSYFKNLPYEKDENN